jgi:hypothetical protein
VKIAVPSKSGGYLGENGNKWNRKWCPECSANYYKNYRVNNSLNKGGYGTAPCKTCGVIFTKKASVHVYCSITCKDCPGSLV